MCPASMLPAHLTGVVDPIYYTTVQSLYYTKLYWNCALFLRNCIAHHIVNGLEQHAAWLQMDEAHGWGLLLKAGPQQPSTSCHMSRVACHMSLHFADGLWKLRTDEITWFGDVVGVALEVPPDRFLYILNCVRLINIWLIHLYFYTCCPYISLYSPVIDTLYSRVDTLYSRIDTLYRRIDTLYSRIDTLYSRWGADKV